MIQRIKPHQVRKGDVLLLPERTYKAVANSKEVRPGVWEVETHSQILRITDAERTIRVDIWTPRLKRKKTGEASYDLLDENGDVVGDAVRTGRPGVDNYPWDWSVDFKTVDGSRTIGNADTLRDAIEYVANAVRNRIDR